ncbi:MAG: bifunctional phosphoglucose/phosphomannose isomerase [Candidatus Omnitrophica bacterium]|nr:bifunctional phosphoglucose/phosphomannose isomerase [Candidatus Omnitrophota bacterium]
MGNLDSAKLLEKYDVSDMLKLIESFPKQVKEAAEIGLRFKLPDTYRCEYVNIVCAGLGGSAIGADIMRSYAADEARMPISVCRNYTLPNFVGKTSLVIVSSYSGNTEETLSAYKDAKDRGAKIIVITSGGQILQMAKADGNACLIIPSGLPPRCALGYSFFPLLTLMSKIGVITDKSTDVDETIRVLEVLRDKKVGAAVAGTKNIAKKIASDLYEKYGIIYGGQDHIDCVVTRWRGQIAENSKALASSHVFPEMNHNEIVGWENPKKVLESFVVIILRDKADHPRTAKRMDISKVIMKKKAAKIIEVTSIGESLLARIFSLVYIGDFVSYYLAILNKCDPTPVESVTYLKNELGKQ